jgi:hypothetical protein
MGTPAEVKVASAAFRPWRTVTFAFPRGWRLPGAAATR